ncbi:MAG: alpha-amylase family protein [Acidobacteriaceae bacterium]
MTRVICISRSGVRLFALLVLAALPALQLHAQQTQDNSDREWLKKVRIAAYSLTPENAEQSVQQAQASGVYGIEVDNDIPGRYESLWKPEVKLEAIRRAAVAAHKVNNKAFVYIAGFECISVNADSSHTVMKEHPEWLQRKITGEPAVFDAKAAFWIRKGEEDAWVSPYAADWRKLYMQRIRQIAGTGIDGIYVDIPYWMTHFTGWEDTWASFDDNTVAEFRRQTGLDARKDVKIGDFADPAFRKWMEFRIRTITEFLAEIRTNAVAVNPSISLIPEIYPGIEAESPRVGADVYQLYPQVDAIAHEYEFGESQDHTAASRTPLDWFQYQVGIRSFRAFAGDKPTWILNYSWDGAPHVKPRDAMLNLFMSELMAGANLWDARGHVMSESNDMATRSEVYHWVAAHEDIFGVHREPIGEVGVYFSDTTRNFYTKDFIASYRGVLLLLLQNHIQFRIVTPRTVSSFDGKVLVLPDVRMVSDAESKSIHQFYNQGGSVVLTGHPDARLNDLSKAHLYPDSPERAYLKSAEADFDHADSATAAGLMSTLRVSSGVDVTASRNVVAHVATIGARHYIFFANFDGLKAGEVATPRTQRDIEIRFDGHARSKLHILPFLGQESVLSSKPEGNGVRFTLPALDRGAVAWID